MKGLPAFAAITGVLFGLLQGSGVLSSRPDEDLYANPYVPRSCPQATEVDSTVELRIDPAPSRVNLVTTLKVTARIPELGNPQSRGPDERTNPNTLSRLAYCLAGSQFVTKDLEQDGERIVAQFDGYPYVNYGPPQPYSPALTTVDPDVTRGTSVYLRLCAPDTVRYASIQIPYVCQAGARTTVNVKVQQTPRQKLTPPAIVNQGPADDVPTVSAAEPEWNFSYVAPELPGKASFTGLESSYSWPFVGPAPEVRVWLDTTLRFRLGWLLSHKAFHITTAPPAHQPCDCQPPPASAQWVRSEVVVGEVSLETLAWYTSGVVAILLVAVMASSTRPPKRKRRRSTVDAAIATDPAGTTEPGHSHGLPENGSQR